MSTSLWARTVSTSSEMGMPVLMPEAKPASKPKTSEPECSSAPERMVSGWLLTASTNTRPMRPLTPAMAIFNALMRFPCDYCAVWAALCSAWRVSMDFWMASPSARTRTSFSK